MNGTGRDTAAADVNRDKRSKIGGTAASESHSAGLAPNPPGAAAAAPPVLIRPAEVGTGPAWAVGTERCPRTSGVPCRRPSAEGSGVARRWAAADGA